MDILRAPAGLYWVEYPRGGGTLFFKRKTNHSGWAKGVVNDKGCSSWSKHTFTEPYHCRPITLAAKTLDDNLERVEAKVAE